MFQVNEKLKYLKLRDHRPERKRSEKGRVRCCQGAQQHQLEQLNQHEQVLQPVKVWEIIFTAVEPQNKKQETAF